MSFTAGCLDLAECGRGRGFVAVNDDDARTLLGKAQRRRAPDTEAAPVTIATLSFSRIAWTPENQNLSAPASRPRMNQRWSTAKIRIGGTIAPT